MSDAALRRHRSLELLTPAAMGQADRWTIEAGTPGLALMERAGAAVAGRVRDLWDGGRILVLCGPGNNGGDGFVAARLLADWGFAVDLRLRGRLEQLKGDAAAAAASWQGPVAALGEPDLARIGLVVDALFGAGLTRALPDDADAWARACCEAGMPVVAVDLASGVAGATGRVEGAAFRAVETVTFGRAKPGHFLLPGFGHRGRLTIADIGLDETAVHRAHHCSETRLWRNRPGLWEDHVDDRAPGDHKYRRGHATVVAGGVETGGAGRLAARAALQAGAGLVTLLAPRAALAVHASQLEAVMVRAADDDDLGDWLDDPRRNAWLLGPGGGVGAALRQRVEAVLTAGRAAVLDADALSCFADEPHALKRLITAPTVLTPHAGEAARLLPTGDDDKLSHARRLAEATGAVVIHKGFDSVVAAPDGRAAIAENGCSALATAGTGDVLAGLVLAQLAQHVPAFEAASSAVWLHNEAAWQAPDGLTSERLVGLLRPAVTLVTAVAA